MLLHIFRLLGIEFDSPRPVRSGRFTSISEVNSEISRLSALKIAYANRLRRLSDEIVEVNEELGELYTIKDMWTHEFKVLPPM